MADKLKQQYRAEVELIESRGGVFEICVEGKLIYSKKKTGEFPDETQLLASLGSL
ncbi:MAG: SelT/SelW/SelH family protein [Deltaproteobacteria bacterium]|nr:SelT/SelW/SelH family protein [Deltaproteobacteria bacterium]NCP02425.1 SelT/SelW/SelH family protein [Deltaproteobacteria bacterium]